jgi:hypothetical protein
VKGTEGKKQVDKQESDAKKETSNHEKLDEPLKLYGVTLGKPLTRKFDCEPPSRLEFRHLDVS